MTTLSEKMTTVVIDAYKLNSKELRETLSFEKQMEQMILSSLLTTFGTGSCDYTPKKDDLVRWGKSISDVASFFEQEGFHVDIIKERHLSISHLTLKDEIKKLTEERL